MLGCPPNKPKSITKEDVLSQITMVEFTIQALESFDIMDRETLMKLLKKNVADVRSLIEKIEVKHK